MQVSSKQLHPHTIEVTIKESGVEMEHIKKHTARRLSEVRQFSGFRKWEEVPVDAVIAEIGEERFMSEVLEDALQSIYPKAIKKLWITPVESGEFVKLVSMSPLEVVMHVEVIPSIELDMKKMEKISVIVGQVSVSDEEMEKELEKIIERATHFHTRWAHHGHSHDENGDLPEETDDTIKIGDKVHVNAFWSDKKWGKIDERMSLSDFELVIGAKMMIPGFEEALIWSKMGDIVEFDVTFPEDYHSADFAGKSAFFSCTILSVEYPHKPQWNEEFIERVWGKKISYEKFVEEFREGMLIDRQTQARSAAEEKLSSEFIKVTDFEVGPKMLAKEVASLWEYHNREIEKQWMDVKTYLEHLKVSEDGFKKEHIEPSAIRRIKSMIILEEMKRHYKPDITEEKVLDEMKKVFGKYAGDPDFEKRLLELAKPGTEHYEDIKSRLQYRDVIERFLK